MQALQYLLADEQASIDRVALLKLVLRVIFILTSEVRCNSLDLIDEDVVSRSCPKNSHVKGLARFIVRELILDYGDLRDLEHVLSQVRHDLNDSVFINQDVLRQENCFRVAQRLEKGRLLRVKLVCHYAQDKLRLLCFSLLLKDVNDEL